MTEANHERFSFLPWRRARQVKELCERVLQSLQREGEIVVKLEDTVTEFHGTIREGLAELSSLEETKASQNDIREDS